MKELVCIGAHADDVELGCLGTVIKLLRQGYRCRFVILTNGESGFKLGDGNTPWAERVRIRKQEQLEVGRRLGLEEVVFLDRQDGFLSYSDELRWRIVEILKRSRPEKVFSFDPANQEYDNINLFHRDHRAAAQLTFDACFAAKNRWLYPGEPHRVEELHFFGSHKPNHFVDISDVIDAKLELLACHRSQFPDLTKLEKLVRERLSGPQGGYAHAEAFRLVRVEQLV
jgi:LmbE family N-acetylglucosaminyl deacetylase